MNVFVKNYEDTSPVKSQQANFTWSAVLPTAVTCITAIKRSRVAAVDTRSVPVITAGKRKPW